MEEAPKGAVRTDSRVLLWVVFFVSRAAVVVTWLVPGLAHFIMGHRKQGVVFAVCIWGMFIGGEFMSGFEGVSPTHYRLTFIGQVCCGGPTLLHLSIFGEPEEDEFQGRVSRWFDAGMLYILIAGLLNIVCIADAVERGLKVKKPSFQRLEMDREEEEEGGDGTSD